MQIDRDYLKALLEAFQGAPGPYIDILELKTAGFAYEEPRFAFHMEILHEKGMIEQPDGDLGFGLTHGIDGFSSWSVLPLRLTAAGHDFLRELSALPLIPARVSVYQGETGWPKVDRQVRKIHGLLESARSEEDWQAIGLQCREILITLAQQVYNPQRHPSVDEIKPSDTDAERMLGAYFATQLRGGANEEARAHAKATLKLAVALQHRRTADARMASLCAEGTFAVVNMVAIIDDLRNQI